MDNIIEISYRKNPAYHMHQANNEPRLFASITLKHIYPGIFVEQLPIYYRDLDRPVGPIRVVYQTRIAGLPLEAGNLNRLEVLIKEFLGVIMRFEHLPVYMFQVNHKAWPVYHVDGQYLTRYPGGPVFTAASIPELRRWLADHFKATGRIANRRDLDLLFFSPFDLQLYAPVCMLRTMTLQTDDIPVFPFQKAGKYELISPVNGITFTADMEHGTGLLSIHGKTAAHFTSPGGEPALISIRKMPVAVWKIITSIIEPYNYKLTFLRESGSSFTRHTLDVFSTTIEGTPILLTGRVNRLNRVSVYLGRSLRELQTQAGSDLYMYGAISHPDDIQPIIGQSQNANPSLLDQTIQNSSFSNVLHY